MKLDMWASLVVAVWVAGATVSCGSGSSKSSAQPDANAAATEAGTLLGRSEVGVAVGAEVGTIGVGPGKTSGGGFGVGFGFKDAGLGNAADLGIGTGLGGGVLGMAGTGGASGGGVDAAADSARKTDTAGAAGSSGGSSSTLADGTVGSSCGTCAAGLTCAPVAGGYCTKLCTSSSDCGVGASCHDDGGMVCFRDCTQDSDCRAGYACVLDPATSSKICYPQAAAGGGTGSSGSASLKGCYWRNRDISYRLYFDGAGRFQEPMYNPVAGSITYSGQYQVSGSQLVLQYSDGTTKTYALQVSGGSVVIIDGSSTYAYAEATCS
jgi:hypothetical protein